MGSALIFISVLACMVLTFSSFSFFFKAGENSLLETDLSLRPRCLCWPCLSPNVTEPSGVPWKASGLQKSELNKPGLSCLVEFSSFFPFKVPLCWRPVTSPVNSRLLDRDLGSQVQAQACPALASPVAGFWPLHAGAPVCRLWNRMFGRQWNSWLHLPRRPVFTLVPQSFCFCLLN